MTMTSKLASREAVGAKEGVQFDAYYETDVLSLQIVPLKVKYSTKKDDCDLDEVYKVLQAELVATRLLALTFARVSPANHPCLGRVMFTMAEGCSALRNGLRCHSRRTRRCCQGWE